MLHMVLAHILASHSTTDCSADNEQHHDKRYEKEGADFHAEDDPWRAVIVVVLAVVWWFIVTIVKNGIFVRRC